MWCTMSHKGCQSNSSADPERPLVGDLKFSQLHSKLSFGIFYFFSFLRDYQNQVPVGLSNIDIVFILSRIPNPILLSLLLETSSHCRLTADIVVIYPFPILAPPPLPLLDRSNDDTWKAEGGFCGADSESTMTHWSTGSSLRSSSFSRDDRSGQDEEVAATQPGWESALGRRWSKEHPQCMNDHLLFHLFFTGQRKGSSMNIINHFLSLFPSTSRLSTWTSCFLHFSSQSSCAFALTPAPVLSSFLPLV